MSELSREVSLEVFDRLANICRRFMELLTNGRSYSLVNLFRSLYQFAAQYRELSEDVRSEVKVKHDMSHEVINFASHYGLYPLYVLFDVMSKLEGKLDKDDVKRVFNALISPIKRLTNDVINEWLVKTARKLGVVSEEFFDNYNVFKDKWNSLLNELEKEASIADIEISLDIRAKELGVTVK